MTDDKNAETAENMMYPSLRIFLSAMDQIRALDEYVAENAKNLNDVAAAFARQAKKFYPSVSYEVHLKAGEVAHRRIHALQAKIDSVADGSASPSAESAEVDGFRRSFSENLQADLTELTGDEMFYFRYAKIWNQVASRPLQTGILRRSILISAVSNFEVLVSGLVRSFLILHPEILKSADQKFSMQELEPFATMEEFRSHCSDAMAESLLRGGFDDWMEWFHKRGLEVPGVSKDADALVEIFQRRHLLVHRGGVVDRFYLSKVNSDSPPEIGKEVGVGGRYLNDAVDELTVAGAKLAISLMWKVAKGEEERKSIGHMLSDHVSYEFLIAGSWSVAQRLNEWHLTFAKQSSAQIVAMVNEWVARKNMYGTKEVAAEVEAWDAETLAGKYRLAKLALLDRNEEAYSLLKSLIRNDEITRENWRHWPLLGGLRQYEASTVDLGERVYPVTFDEAHTDPDKFDGSAAASSGVPSQ